MVSKKFKNAKKKILGLTPPPPPPLKLELKPKLNQAEHKLSCTEFLNYYV
jgi:hypothetical protein